jgi:threonine dehydratase
VNAAELNIPDLTDIRAAADRIAGMAVRTPIVRNDLLDELSGAQLLFKCENLQRGGAFKFRGAANAVFSLTDSQARAGVATHSSGNHAIALALAARLRGIPAHIVLPENTTPAKRQAVEAAGGRIIHCPPTLEARQATARRVVDETGAILIHPYDNPLVIAGQGTAAMELLEQVRELDMLIAPVSGGGLLGGCAIAARALCPSIEVYGAEPDLADDARQSLHTRQLRPAGNAITIADGLRAALSDRTFTILREHVHDILTASEDQIISGMKLMWQHLKLVVEPSAAVPLAAILAHPQPFAGRRVGIILSGGNVDLDRLPWLA